jgi:hypothetical protein
MFFEWLEWLRNLGFWLGVADQGATLADISAIPFSRASKLTL